MRSVRISAWVLAMLLTCSPLSALAVETDLLPARRAAPDFSDTAGKADAPQHNCRNDIHLITLTGPGLSAVKTPQHD